MRVRDRLTAATAELMQRHGVAGTGISDILEASGVTRRSIYLNFPGGKAELVAAATQSAGDEMTATLREYLEQPRPVAAFIQMWCDALVSTDFRSGCAIVAAACGRGDAPEAAVAAGDVFAQWAELLSEALARDGVDRAAAESLSTTVVAAVEGAIILARAAQSTKPLEQVSHHLEELIALHRPPSTRGRRKAERN